jgi:hypothetical protein
VRLENLTSSFQLGFRGPRQGAAVVGRPRRLPGSGSAGAAPALQMLESGK